MATMIKELAPFAIRAVSRRTSRQIVRGSRRNFASLHTKFYSKAFSSTSDLDGRYHPSALLASATLLLLGASVLDNSVTMCEARNNNREHEEPIEYTAEDVAKNNGQDGSPVWMTYAGIVYDVTSFVSNHPGGNQLLKAAGGPIEPHWHIYRQHFASDLAMRLLEPMAIGTLKESDQDLVDAKMEEIMEHEVDPYEFEPERKTIITDKDGAPFSMKVHSDKPMNAEVPEHLLTRDYLTPSDLFYMRHHHPVPYLSQKQIDNYKLIIDLSEYGKGTIGFSLDDLKSMPKEEITVTLQCSGNRRSGYNVFEKTSGTTWGQGAISTAKWGGVRLSELLKNAGMGDPILARDKGGIEHVRFGAVDGVQVSIGIEKATNPYGDVMVCYEMNGEDLPRDHGYPIRLIVPGYAGVRSLKWLRSIAIAKEEAEGPWQRGLNYKVLPPNVHDANEVDISKMPACNELSVSSGITSLEPIGLHAKPTVGDVVMMKVSGWAFSGGGRNIVRVDVTGDAANHAWMSADLKEGSDQRYGMSWAWTFWEAEVPAKVQDDGAIHIYCKGVDMAFNSQPEKAVDQWNVRGLMNNSWYHRTIVFQ